MTRENQSSASSPLLFMIFTVTIFLHCIVWLLFVFLMFVLTGTNLLKNATNSCSREMAPLNVAGVRDVVNDIRHLYDANERDLRAVSDAEGESAEVTLAVIHLRHATVERLRRCGLAYLSNRLQKLTTFYGDIGGPTNNLQQQTGECNALDLNWISARSKAFSEYQRAIGMDMSSSMQPPSRCLRTTVRCKVDFGPLFTSDGHMAVLARDAIVELPSSDADRLLRLGYLERLKS